MTGKTYTDEFKRAAVARLATEKRAGIAKDLKVAPSVIYAWRKKFEAAGEPAVNGRSSHRRYPEDFKRQAVARCLVPGDAAKVAAELGITSGMISQWRSAFKGKGNKRGKKAKANGAAKSYYVPVAERSQGVATENGMLRAVKASISLLRGVRAKANTEDPVHLTALLVLATLEGKL
jgi:transposase-like protein